MKFHQCIVKNETDEIFEVDAGENLPENVLLPTKNPDNIIKPKGTLRWKLGNSGTAKMYIWNQNGIKLWSGTVPSGEIEIHTKPSATFELLRHELAPIEVRHHDQVLPQNVGRPTRSSTQKSALDDPKVAGFQLEKNTGSSFWKYLLVLVIVIFLIVIFRYYHR